MIKKNNLKKTYKQKRFYLIITLLAIFIAIVFMSVFSSAVITTTIFNDSVNAISLKYPFEYLTQKFFLKIPKGAVSEARIRIQGFDLAGLKINPADVVLVTDTSGSMAWLPNGSSCPTALQHLNRTGWTLPLCVSAGASTRNIRCSCCHDCTINCPTPPCITRIMSAKEADINFINNINLEYINVGLVHYATSAIQDSLPSSNGANLISIINNYNAVGSTNLGGGMQLAIDVLFNSNPLKKKYMVLMTDGQANCNKAGVCSNNLATIAEAKAWVIEMADLARANNVTIYTIAFGNCGTTTSDADCNLMNNIATITNGSSYNTADPATLNQIYIEIAGLLDIQDFPMPNLKTTSPAIVDGWSYSSSFISDIIWDDLDCGDGIATCEGFRSLLQSNINNCLTPQCIINFSIYSETVGMLNLSDLYIEVNEAPIGNNVPPIGICRKENLSCVTNNIEISLDDGVMVTDPNDPLDTLSWRFNRSVRFDGQVSTFNINQNDYFIINSDFNTTRSFDITNNDAHISENSWVVYYFNVSDPWEANTSTCLNLSFTTCFIGGFCGDRQIRAPNNDGFNEECDNNASDNFGECAMNCTKTFCGDGIIQALNGNNEAEVCDDGNTNSSDGCSAVCQTERITCNAVTPKYLLQEGETVSVPFTDIFNFNDFTVPINITLIQYNIEPDIGITNNLPEGFNATGNIWTSEAYTLNFNITTDKGVESDFCSATFITINSKCNKPECDACITSNDYSCLVSNDCLDDKQIMIFNPYTIVKIPRLFSFPDGASNTYSVEEFRALLNSGFKIEPAIGIRDQSTFFKISNNTALPELTKNASIIRLKFIGYNNYENPEIRLCPSLKRLNYKIGETSFNPNTPLLITGSRAVTGFYQIGDSVQSKGPYIFIAKVWLKE